MFLPHSSESLDVFQLDSQSFLSFGAREGFDENGNEEGDTDPLSENDEGHEEERTEACDTTVTDLLVAVGRAGARGAHNRLPTVECGDSKESVHRSGDRPKVGVLVSSENCSE